MSERQNESNAAEGRSDSKALLGAGLYIGINDRDGNPIHIGDTLEFDEKERGDHCVFIIELNHGQIQHPGVTSDLPNWCRVVKRVGT